MCYLARGACVHLLFDQSVVVFAHTNSIITAAMFSKCVKKSLLTLYISYYHIPLSEFAP